MHLNYHFLKHLVKELREVLIGNTLTECYSQNKDELILSVSGTQNTHYIKAYLSGSFSCLTFPEVHHRAKRNSIDLFSDIIGKKFVDISITSNDRSFLMHLSDGFSLLFKLHGNRSNIVLFKGAEYLGMFNHGLKKDEHVTPQSLSKESTTSLDDWLANPNLRSAFPTFGPRVFQYLQSQGFESSSVQTQWSLILDAQEAMKQTDFYISQDDGAPFLSLFKQGKILSQHSSAMEACNALSRYYHQTYLFERDKSKYLQQLKSDRQKAIKYVEHTRQKLEQLTNKRPFDEVANIIMANLHAIPKGSSTVELLDFYNNTPIEIKLKPESSPQKQAEQYYRKSKNQSKERENLESNIKKKENDIEVRNRLIDELSSISGRKQMNQFVQTHLPGTTQAQGAVRLPFHQHEIEGFEIRIGKSAKDNDLMLRQYSHKDDLWLHARDVAGSHVLIRHQKSRPFLPTTIEQAAQLAAFYSKRKHDTLAPVIYTHRKFVRKAKNLLAGQVLVEKEQVILVKPAK